MKTRFILPVVVALVAHGIFLFGLKPERPQRVAAATPAEPTKPARETPATNRLTLTAADSPPARVSPASDAPPQPRSELNRADFVPTADQTTRQPPTAAITMTDDAAALPRWTMRQIDESNHPETHEWLEKMAGNYGQIQTLNQLDQVPVMRTPASESPASASDPAAETVIVWVTFVVNTRGEVESALADEGEPMAYAKAAEALVQTWKFAPSTKKGKPVVFRMSAPVPVPVQR